MARMGMDVDLVEQEGNKLKKKASDLGALMAEINSIVSGLPAIWDGKDANEFVHNWWPGHRQSLQSVINSIDGLGQSALNNASEQRDVSNR